MPRARRGSGPAERRASTRLHPEVRRRQIVTAAVRVFETRDPAEVTFEEIAEAAGVSRALVYNYFGDRGGLLAAVYTHAFEDVDVEVRQASTGAAGDPAARTRAMLEAYVRVAAANPGVWRLLLLSQAIDHPKLRDARRARIQSLAEAWGGSARARLAATSVVAGLEAATAEWLDTGEIDAAELAGVLFDLLWHGIAQGMAGERAAGP